MPKTSTKDLHALAKRHDDGGPSPGSRDLYMNWGPNPFTVRVTDSVVPVPAAESNRAAHVAELQKKLEPLKAAIDVAEAERAAKILPHLTARDTAVHEAELAARSASGRAEVFCELVVRAGAIRAEMALLEQRLAGVLEAKQASLAEELAFRAAERTHLAAVVEADANIQRITDWYDRRYAPTRKAAEKLRRRIEAKHGE